MNFEEWFGKGESFCYMESDHRYVSKVSYNAGQQSQQVKIDELQKLRSLDEVAINQLAQANQVWQIKCDELQNKLESLEHTSGEVVGVISMSCANYLCENKKMQKAIDDIKNHLEGLSEKHVSTHAYLGVLDILDILDILKGNKDEI